jgi:hypothetical protein
MYSSLNLHQARANYLHIITHKLGYVSLCASISADARIHNIIHIKKSNWDKPNNVVLYDNALVKSSPGAQMRGGTLAHDGRRCCV